MKTLTNQYYIIYERDEKNGYIASAPAIPGCVVYGKTLQEAYKNIYSAIKECLEVIHKFHRELPKETIKPTHYGFLKYANTKHQPFFSSND